MAGHRNRRGLRRLGRAVGALAGGCLRRHLALRRKSDALRVLRRQAVLERRSPGAAEALSERFERGYADGVEGLRPRPAAGSRAGDSAYGLGYVAGELTALANGCGTIPARRRIE